MKALNIMHDKYVEKANDPDKPLCDHCLSKHKQKKTENNMNWFGTETLAKAYNVWSGENVTNGTHKHASHPGAFELSYLFIEKRLFKQKEWGLQLRKNEWGDCCNFVVGDEKSKQGFFWSRFVDSGETCQRRNEKRK